MKKLILVLALTLAGVSTHAQSKIGTIDADYILGQMPEFTEVTKGLETYNADLQKDLDSTITKYEILIKEYQETNTTLTDEEKKQKEAEIISLENDIKGFRQKASVLLQMRRNELTQPLYEKINEAMLQVISEKNFTQIFHANANALAYSVEGSDITLDVLSKLGIKVTEASQTQK